MRASLDPTASIALEAMAEAHDMKKWRSCSQLGDAWIAARGELPALASVWYAQSLMAVGRLSEALRWAEGAARTIPATDLVAKAAARATYAQALARAGRFTAARRQLRHLTAEPLESSRETLEKQGHVLLAIAPERWADAWRMHEARESNKELPDGLPRWDGRKKCRVAVLHEQGIGDAVLFARWLGEVCRRTDYPATWFGPEAVLGRWIGGIPGAIVGERSQLGLLGVDAAVYAMSLPHVLECSYPEAVPLPAAPYQLEIQSLRRRSYGRPDGEPFRVGVCWKGAAHGWHDFERSFTYGTFARVCAPLEGVEFVNLTHDAEVPESAPFPRRTFEDVYETGLLASELDMVVTVDTALAHIAGSLGVPSVVIVPTVPDWRWSWPDGSEVPGRTPFYPSVQVIRRRRADDLSVIARARRMIERAVS
jgi:hypothetical protein